MNDLNKLQRLLLAVIGFIVIVVSYFVFPPLVWACTIVSAGVGGWHIGSWIAAFNVTPSAAAARPRPISSSCRTSFRSSSPATSG